MCFIYTCGGFFVAENKKKIRRAERVGQILWNTDKLGGRRKKKAGEESAWTQNIFS